MYHKIAFLCFISVGEKKLMEKEFEIAKLIAAEICGKITEKEKDKLEEWQKTSSGNESLYHTILKKENIRAAGKELQKFDKQNAWKNILSRITIIPVAKKQYLPAFFKYAAIFILIAGGWILFYQKPISHPTAIVAKENPVIDSCQQGIILTLANGETINLKENSGQIKISEDRIIKMDTSPILSYRNIHDSFGLLSQQFNKIYVNRGEVYQLELSDGSKVYLNSMSKVKYPVSFGMDKREIELEGEAYLEIAKDVLRPFIVKTKNFAIKVLGTKFNMKAYPEDAEAVTTLVEGCVQIENPQYGIRTQLHPNEQLHYEKLTNSISVKEVDVSYATAWLEGKIRFRDISLENLMIVLKRWYDIEVEYETPELGDLMFGCNFNRMDSIDKIIEVFEQTQKIKIIRHGRILKLMTPD